MGKSTRKGKQKATTVEEPLQSIPETPQEEKASAWGVPSIDQTRESAGGGWNTTETTPWGGGGEEEQVGLPGGWDTEPPEHAHHQSPASANSPRTLPVSPRSYASAKLDIQASSVKDFGGLQPPPFGLQPSPLGLQSPPPPAPPAHDWDSYPTKPPPAPPPASALPPTRRSSKNSKHAPAPGPPRASYNAPAAYTATAPYNNPAAYRAPATHNAAGAYATPGTGRGAGFSSWQNWAAEVGMAPPAQQTTHVKFASRSTHIPSTAPSATMQQANRSAWKSSGRQSHQAPPAANNGWGGGGGGGWESAQPPQTWGVTEQQGWGAHEQQGWGAQEHDNYDEGNGGDWDNHGDEEWGDGWDEGGAGAGGGEWDTGGDGGKWDTGGGGEKWDAGGGGGGGGGGWGQEDDGGWQDWGAETGKGGGWGGQGAEAPKTPAPGGHNDGWQNWGKRGDQREQSWGREQQRTSQPRYWSPSPDALDDRPISHTMAYATGATSPKNLKRYSSDKRVPAMAVPPGWTLAHKGMDLYKTHKFALTEDGNVLASLDLPLFNRDRFAKDRLRWLFPPDKDPRVSTALRWIKDVEHGLGAFALDVYLSRHERGALVVNAATFYPPAPEFDWLDYHAATETLDKRIQESIVTYDPAKHAIVMVFLPSATGNSAAVWRRRVEVPGSVRSKHKRAIRSTTKTVVKPEKEVFVDELTKPEDAKKRKKKKKGFWKRLFGGIKIVW